MSAIKKMGRTPLVFVHGFNVRYQEAVLRAAQINYDLKYQGPIILFSWPAGAGDGFFDDKFLFCFIWSFMFLSGFFCNFFEQGG